MRRINEGFGWIVVQVMALCMIGPIFGVLCALLANGRLR